MTMTCTCRIGKASQSHLPGSAPDGQQANASVSTGGRTSPCEQSGSLEQPGVIVVKGAKYYVNVSSSDGENEENLAFLKGVVEQLQQCKGLIEVKRKKKGIPDNKYWALSNLLIVVQNAYYAMEKLTLNSGSLTEETHKQLQPFVHQVSNICTTLHETLSGETPKIWKCVGSCGISWSKSQLKDQSSKMHKASMALWELQRQSSSPENLAGKYQLRKAGTLPEYVVGPVGAHDKNLVCWWTKTEKCTIYMIDNEEYRVILPETTIADVTCLLFSGNYLWTGHRDGSLGWWCIDTCSLLHYSRNALSSQPQVMVECVDDRLWIGTSDGTLYGVTLSAGSTSSSGKVDTNCRKIVIRFQFTGHSTGIVTMVSASNFFWSASSDVNSYCVKCWDAETGTMIGRWCAENECLKQLVLHSKQMNHFFLFGALASGRVHVWNVLNPRSGMERSKVTIQETRGMGDLLSAFMIGRKFCQAYSTGVLLFWPEEKVTLPQKLMPPSKLVAHKGGMANACPVGQHGTRGMLTTSCTGAIVYWTLQEIDLLLAVPESMHGESQLKQFELALQGQVGHILDADKKLEAALNHPSTIDPGNGSFYRVQLRKEIGEGGFGKVYYAKWGVVDVAVKTLIPPDSMKYKPKEVPEIPFQLVQRMASEAFMMGSLRHPNVLLFLGYSTEPPCIITEFCARGSLYHVLHKRYSTVLSERLRLHIALGAAAGMAYLHNQTPSILHRDLKSTNILIDRNWTAKIADFGLSTMLVGSKHESSCGVHSPQWAAPEVLGEGIYSKASDVYSFGIILWEILTFERPWSRLSAWQVMHAVVVEDARPGTSKDLAEQANKRIAAQLLPLIEKCWATKPEERPTFVTICRELEVTIHLLEAADREATG